MLNYIRMLSGLVFLVSQWLEVQEWVAARMNKEQRVEVVTGVLNTFIVEPFVPHEQSDEYYVCIQVLHPTHLNDAL